MWVAKPNYRHQKRQREAQRLTRQAEKLQKRQAAARVETGEPGEAAADTLPPEGPAAAAAEQKPAG
jgi:hypothetical protein